MLGYQYGVIVVLFWSHLSVNLNIRVTVPGQALPVLGWLLDVRDQPERLRGSAGERYPVPAAGTRVCRLPASCHDHHASDGTHSYYES
eukprot:3381485-Rhodomonas_salina.2